MIIYICVYLYIYIYISNITCGAHWWPGSSLTATLSRNIPLKEHKRPYDPTPSSPQAFGPLAPSNEIRFCFGKDFFRCSVLADVGKVFCSWPWDRVYLRGGGDWAQHGLRQKQKLSIQWLILSRSMAFFPPMLLGLKMNWLPNDDTINFKQILSSWIHFFVFVPSCQVFER